MKYKRKSQDEIVKIKRRMFKNVLLSKEPLVYGAVSMPTFFLLISFIPSRNTGDIRGPSLKILLFSVLIGIGVSVFTYIFQLISRREISDESYFGICRSCLSSNHDGKSKCKCGGKIEPQEYYDEM